MLVLKIYSSFLSSSATHPDSGGNLGDTGIIGKKILNGMAMDLMNLGGHTWQFPLHIMHRKQAENLRKTKKTEELGFFHFRI